MGVVPKIWRVPFWLRATEIELRMPSMPVHGDHPLDPGLVCLREWICPVRSRANSSIRPSALVAAATDASGAGVS